MRSTQFWQNDGVGTSAPTLCRIIGEFKEKGVQGVESCAALTAYINKLNTAAVETMLRLDEETTLQILVDTLGAKEAFKKTLDTYKDAFREEMRLQGWISPKNYEEACQKYADRVAQAQEEKDNTESRLFEALRREDKLLKQIEEQKYTILVLKAKLYDAYEAMNEPTDKNNIKGDMQPCRAKTEKTPSGSLE